MQKSNAPTKLTVAFASGTGAGPVNTIPLTTNPTSGGASYQTGFTSVNMEPIASGGVPPYGADVNGLFQNQTRAQIWQQAGYMYPFDATFAGNANIGGYPAGSVLMMGGGKGLWINQSDNNTTSPDATGSAGWLGVAAAGTSTINTTGGTTTPDPSVLGVTTLIVTGALTSNATLVLPLTEGARWIVANNTTGSYTLTVQGSSGSGVSITSGTPIAVFTDGTNYYGVSANLSGAYLPIGGTAVAATKLATARTIAMTGDVSWTSQAFDGTANVTAAGTIANGAVSLAKMASFQANSLMGNPTGSAATPSAITLQNGLTFSGSNLGLGSITVTGISCGGNASVTGSLSANGTASVSSAAGQGATAAMTLSDTSSNRIGIIPNTGNTSWNGISQAGDAAIIYALAGGGTPGSGLVIAPWASGSVTSGLRLAANGALSVAGSISTTSTITAAGNIQTNGLLQVYTGVAASGPANIYIGYNNNVVRWAIGQGTAAQFALYTYNTSGSYTGNPFLMDQSGNLTTTGTINMGTSDRRLKTNLKEVALRPLHRGLPWYTYDRIDIPESGRGPMAQDAEALDPALVREYDHRTADIQARRLAMDKLGIALEEALWAGTEVDNLVAALGQLTERVARLEVH